MKISVLVTGENEASVIRLNEAAKLIIVGCWVNLKSRWCWRRLCFLQRRVLQRAATPPSSTRGSSAPTYVSIETTTACSYLHEQLWFRTWRLSLSSQVRCWGTCSWTCSVSPKCTRTRLWAPFFCTTTTTTSSSRWRSEFSFFYVLDLHFWHELFVWMNSGTMEVFFHGPFSKCDLICFLFCVFWLENWWEKSLAR